jgi:hypothetical protein
VKSFCFSFPEKALFILIPGTYLRFTQVAFDGRPVRKS